MDARRLHAHTPQTEQVSVGKIINITIPSTLSPPYSYTFDLVEPTGLQFLATMYDAEGFGSGGTTGVLSESIHLLQSSSSLTQLSRRRVFRQQLMFGQVCLKNLWSVDPAHDRP